MYKLQVKIKKRWVWGINTYDTLTEAERRIDELSKVGISARVKEEAEFTKSL